MYKSVQEIEDFDQSDSHEINRWLGVKKIYKDG